MTRHTIALAAALVVSMAGNIALTVKLVSSPPAHPNTLSIKAPSGAHEDARLTLLHMYVAARMNGESVCLTDLPDGALWYHSCAQPGRWTR